MTTLLDLPEFRQRVHPMSVETYHRLGEMGLISEKVELLHGIVVNKMSKSPLHEFVCQKLMKLLLAAVPAGFEVRREGPLTLADSEPEPDLSVVRGQVEDWTQAHPATASLVIEVAVTSPLEDEGKGEIYAAAGIPEYWLVRPRERRVDIFRQPTEKGYLSKSTFTEKDRLKSSAVDGVEIAVAAIFPSSR